MVIVAAVSKVFNAVLTEASSAKLRVVLALPLIETIMRVVSAANFS